MGSEKSLIEKFVVIEQEKEELQEILNQKILLFQEQNKVRLSVDVVFGESYNTIALTMHINVKDH